MAEYRIEALTPQTWEAYARLMERHNGVFGGCWCTYFQTMHDDKTFDADDNRSLKQRLVEEDRAHAALVFDGDEAVAWASAFVPWRYTPASYTSNGTGSLKALMRGR